jgi:uncharacterized membrane protein YkvA (DUF1232 family)
MSEHDPFPRERFSALLRHVPAYARLAWRLGRDPLLSRARRAAVAGAAAYLVSPVDAIPGVIPVLGQVDDLLVALAAIRLALDGLRPERRQAHLAAVGLTEHEVADDFRVTGAIGLWVARAGARTGVAAAAAVSRGLARGAEGAAATVSRMGAAAAGDVGPAIARLGAELDRRVSDRVRLDLPKLAEGARERVPAQLPARLAAGVKAGVDRIPGPRVPMPRLPAFRRGIAEDAQTAGEATAEDIPRLPGGDIE